MTDLSTGPSRYADPSKSVENFRLSLTKGPDAAQLIGQGHPVTEAVKEILGDRRSSSEGTDYTPIKDRNPVPASKTIDRLAKELAHERIEEAAALKHALQQQGANPSSLAGRVNLPQAGA